LKFDDPEFLRAHIRSILDFYAPRLVDPEGGFFQNFLDDGRVFDPGERHLVSSCRMVFNCCKGYELFEDPAWLRRAEHGLDFIRLYHWDAKRQGYNWTLKDGRTPDDQTNQCYGLAFVLLSAAAARQAGIDGAEDDMEQAAGVMNERFWDESAGLYADEATPDWSAVDGYRGQNANMHSCEAFLAAYEAVGKKEYLDRAYALARKVTVELATKPEGLVWEHYTEDLEINWTYNFDDPKNLYRPWGYQPGHQAEWAKLLLTLHDHRPEPWMIERATTLFDRALDLCWDGEYGGIYYGFAPNGSICDDDKYFWVQAESFAAAARLRKRTGEPKYADWYERIWKYAWAHMIDHRHGGWYRVLTRDNRRYSDRKSAAGAKCDYHTLGACWDVLRDNA